MRNSLRLVGAVSAMLALGACSYNPVTAEANARIKASAAWKQGADPADAHTDELLSEAAAQRGDWAVSSDFAERSYKQTPDLTNEFNLATAYQRTGRGALAIPLYIDLMDRGQYTPAVSLLHIDGTGIGHAMAPTIAAEASARLAQMGVDQTQLAGASAPTPRAIVDSRQEPHPYTDMR